ncbi:hypothetical protein [Kordiimonas sp.]|uniref:hypothetical protein n=1 Tax=Kordiimonas sp. TaxID=1970157 RepID=UPI003A912FBC
MAPRLWPGRASTRAILLATAIGISASFGQVTLSAASQAADAPTANPGETLIGTPLRTPDFSQETFKRLSEDLAIAEARMRIAPDREDSFIWLGRRHGYLANYEKAVEVFTQGLAKYPESYRLLRYRARHLARSRQFAQSITDYERAAQLMEDLPDTVEPDGMPNALGLPLGTYKSNIHYYWGQTSFAVGDYTTMLRGMERAMELVPDYAYNDLLVPTSLWRYMALMKLGRRAEAQRIIRAVPSDLSLIENHAYYQAVQYLNGNLEEAESKSKNNILLAFTIAMQDMFEGNHTEAQARLEHIVKRSALGFWPAEVELVSTYKVTPQQAG